MWQQISEPSYINLRAVLEIFMANPSVIWISSKTVHSDNTCMQLLDKESEELDAPIH